MTVSNPNGQNSLGFPVWNAPFVDNRGYMTLPWRLFFQNLYLRIGGPSSPSIPEIINMHNSMASMPHYDDLGGGDEATYMPGPQGPQGAPGTPGQIIYLSDDGSDSGSLIPGPQGPAGPQGAAGGLYYLSDDVMSDATSDALVVSGLSAGSHAYLSGLTMSGAITPSYPSGVVGDISGNSVTAGSIGEIITASATAGLTNATAAGIVSISVTAGKWIVFGMGMFDYAGGATSSLRLLQINNSIAFTGGNYIIDQTSSGVEGSYAVSPIPVISNSTQTYYLVMQSNFAGGTMSGTASITAMRVG